MKLPNIILITQTGKELSTNSITIQGNWIIYNVGDGGGFRMPQKMMSIVNVKQIKLQQYEELQHPIKQKEAQEA